MEEEVKQSFVLFYKEQLPCARFGDGKMEKSPMTYG